MVDAAANEHRRGVTSLDYIQMVLVLLMIQNYNNNIRPFAIAYSPVILHYSIQTHIVLM